jgi:hypothetical protein
MSMTLQDRAVSYQQAFGRFPAGHLRVASEVDLLPLFAIQALTGLRDNIEQDFSEPDDPTQVALSPEQFARRVIVELDDLITLCADQSTFWSVEEQSHEVLYGLWLIGQDYVNPSKYYGAHPKGYLDRVHALFPDVEPSPAAVLHAFSGSLPAGPYTRCDLLQASELQCDVRDLAARSGGRRWRLIFADPPYSQDDAKKYGTLMIDRGAAMRSFAQVCEPAGHVVWLDTVWPMFRKDEWRTVGRICLVRSTNHRVRLISIFERLPGEEAA